MNIIKMIQQNNMLKIALILVAVYFFMKYYNKEGLDNTEVIAQPHIVQDIVAHHEDALESQHQVQTEQIDKVVAGQAQLTTNDLLPIYDEANEFAKQNPASSLLQEQNFLQAGYHMGINTVIQSNKIPYLDLRSAPPIPKGEAGPWNQSSYETPVGFGRKFLEIGN